MRPLISFITVVAFGLHILLGCCTHHSHADVVPTAKVAGPKVAVTPKTCSHGHHHEHGHHHGDHPQVETPVEHSFPEDNSHDDCHESHCQFLLTATTSLTVEANFVPLTALPVDDVTCSTALTSRFVAQITAADSSRLPVRLYLCHQAFLN